MTKDEYRTYCERTADLPLFLQAWWMDAVCVGKQWEVIAGMPCLVRRRLGMDFVLMPQQTQLGGRAVVQGERFKVQGVQGVVPLSPTDSCFKAFCKPADLSACSGAALTPAEPVLLNPFTPNPGEQLREVAEEVAEALKARGLAYYYQHWPIGSAVPKELEKRGFTIREHRTYRIEDLTDMAAVERRFSKNKQRQIQKAAGLEVAEMTPEAFYAFHQDCLQQQGKEISYSRTFFDSLDAACKAHDARKILGLRDERGEWYAAAYLVYDKQTCYYLMPCYSLRRGDSGAGARIVQESIRFAASVSKVFDFEGSMIPGVARHYAEFGSVAATFYEVEKVYHPMARVALKVYHYLSRKKR